MFIDVLESVIVLKTDSDDIHGPYWLNYIQGRLSGCQNLASGYKYKAVYENS
jgi:hypothetical protein